MTKIRSSDPARRILEFVQHGLLGARGDQRPAQIIFVAVYSLVFLLSGLLSTATSDVYRMGLVSVLVIPLVLLYGVEFDAVLVAFTVLTLAISVSAMVSHASLREFIVFMRIPAFGYLMFYLAKSVMSQENTGRILRVSIIISLIQLPIVLAQNLIVGGVDSDYGTFNVQCDYAMSFFITLSLILVLFRKVEFGGERLRLPIAFWLTLTVFVANSNVSQLIVAMVWGGYLFSKFELRRAAVVTLMGISVTATLLGLNKLGALTESPLVALTLLQRAESSSAGEPFKTYTEGGYDRPGAIRYFLAHPISWFGDGPSKYYDVFTKTYKRGNMGHVYTFYSETGLAGLVSSVVALFAIAFTRSWRMELSPVRVLAFASILALAFTSQVMNDIAVMLIYSIVVRSQGLLAGRPTPQAGIAYA